MIDSAKLSMAASILAKYPAGIVSITSSRVEDTEGIAAVQLLVELEGGETIKITIEDSLIDPDPYVMLVKHGANLLGYFCDRAVLSEEQYDATMLAFQITFNALREEVKELKLKIEELTKE